jgi:hypothetical protein
MGLITWLGFAAGLVLVLATAASVLETTIVPRGSRSGLTPLILRLVNLPIRLLASRIEDYERRDGLLAYASAAYLVATLVVWLALFLVGYALMLWPSASPCRVAPSPPPSSTSPPSQAWWSSPCRSPTCPCCTRHTTAAKRW